MNQPPAIPLPDAEVLTCYTSARVLSPYHCLSQYPDSIRARALRWALEADAIEFDVLMLVWPDNHFCFAIVRRDVGNFPGMLSQLAILAAYRHALNDPHAQKLFYSWQIHNSLIEGK